MEPSVSTLRRPIISRIFSPALPVQYFALKSKILLLCRLLPGIYNCPMKLRMPRMTNLDAQNHRSSAA